jgi:uncharacterized protein
MKAIVISQYGGPQVLEYKDFPEPSPGPDEVLVRVVATSINPFDLKQRSGEAKAFAPINFPGVLGLDVTGTVISCGEKVEGFSAGDRVFGMAGQTYAERCIVKAKSLAKIWKVKSFDKETMFTDGENVAIFGRFTYISAVLSKTVTSPFAVFAKVRDGRCTYMQFMEDTFATGASFRSGGKWIFHSDPKGTEISI